jgi:hypothetical protein
VGFVEQRADLLSEASGTGLTSSEAGDDLGNVALEPDSLVAGGTVLEVTLDLVTLGDRKQFPIEKEVRAFESLSTSFLHDRCIPVTDIS